MTSSGFARDETDASALATPWDNTQIRDIPAAGLYASLEDMGRFLQMVPAGGEPVLAKATFAEMTKRQNADVPLDLDFPMGLGFQLAYSIPISIPKLFSVGHGGALEPVCFTGRRFRCGWGQEVRSGSTTQGSRCAA